MTGEELAAAVMEARGLIGSRGGLLYVGKSRTNGLGYRESGIQQVYGGNHNVGGRSHFYKSVAMGIDWMSEEDLNEAIPPAYTRFVGQHLMHAVRRQQGAEDNWGPGDRGWTG